MRQNNKSESVKVDSMGIVPRKSDPVDWDPNHTIAYTVIVWTRDEKRARFCFKNYVDRELFTCDLERLFQPIRVVYETRVVDKTKTPIFGEENRLEYVG